MTKPARKLPAETTAAIAGFRAATRDRVLNERLDEMELRFFGEIRSLRTLCDRLVSENNMLKGRVLVLEAGSRIPAERREAGFARIAACGNGGGNAR
jgi:hypothetical protein